MKKYFIMDGEDRKGPFTLDQLEEAGVTPETYVWCKGMEDWQQAAEVGDICRYFRQTLHGRMYPQLPVTINVSQAQDPLQQQDIPMRWRYYLMKSGLPAEMTPEPEPDTDTPPASWLWGAIAATLLCCFLTGIIAIYFSLRSRKLWNDGKRVEAHAAARSAHIWVLASLVSGCFILAWTIRTGFF